MPTTTTNSPSTFTAFAGDHHLASGELTLVALAAQQRAQQRMDQLVLVFDDANGRQVDLDYRGTPEQMLARLSHGGSPLKAPGQARGPGRPKLGVVAREVTLLPRHWEWLNAQPGGASVTLRKLVEDARRSHAPRERVRNAQDAAYRFLLAMAGNAPGYEEALRALYAADGARFAEYTEGFPADVRDHARRLAGPAFGRP